MPDKIDISNERKLTAEELSSLVAGFLEEHPAAFEKWIELERAEGGVAPIWERATEFLKLRCKYRSITDLDSAAFAMRRELYRIATKKPSGEC